MNRPSNAQRTAGLAYLLVIVAAGFAQGGVREALVIPGDAAATSANIIGNELLFRFGLAADLLAFLADAVVALMLYVVLRPAGHLLSAAAAAFRLIAHPAIGSLNLIHHWNALDLLTSSGVVDVLGQESVAAMALQSMEAHATGYLLAGAFFGVHLLLAAVLIVRTKRFPSLLGWMVGLAGVAYLLESFGMLVYPDLESVYTGFVVVSAVIGEVFWALWMVFTRN